MWILIRDINSEQMLLWSEMEWFGHQQPILRHVYHQWPYNFAKKLFQHFGYAFGSEKNNLDPKCLL